MCRRFLISRSYAPYLRKAVGQGLPARFLESPKQFKLDRSAIRSPRGRFQSERDLIGYPGVVDSESEFSNVESVKIPNPENVAYSVES